MEDDPNAICVQFTNAEIDRLIGVRDAARALLSLPNWENRVGPWKDITDAAASLKRALDKPRPDAQPAARG